MSWAAYLYKLAKKGRLGRKHRHKLHTPPDRRIPARLAGSSFRRKKKIHSESSIDHLEIASDDT